MKKFLQFSAFLCLFLMATTAQAQISVGVRAGLNLATYNFKFPTSTSSTDKPNFSNIALLTVGVPMEMMINKNFAIQAELNFVQKGFGTTFEGSGFKADSKIIVNWLEIPLLAKAKFGEAEGVGGAVFFGPSVGYGLSGKSKSTNTLTINGVSTTSTDSETLNFKDDEHSRVDVGLNIGGELTYKGIFFDARYQLGVTNMFTGDSSTNGDVKATTRGLAVTVGYRLPLSK